MNRINWAELFPPKKDSNKNVYVDVKREPELAQKLLDILSSDGSRNMTLYIFVIPSSFSASQRFIKSIMLLDKNVTYFYLDDIVADAVLTFACCKKSAIVITTDEFKDNVTFAKKLTD